MSELFQGILNWLSLTLGLPIDYFNSYIIMTVIGVIAFLVAFFIAGKMYKKRIIHGRREDQDWHWFIRLIVFVAIWAIASVIIRVYNFFAEYPLIVDDNSHNNYDRIFV